MTAVVASNPQHPRGRESVSYAIVDISTRR
jgi:hypothetical protein